MNQNSLKFARYKITSRACILISSKTKFMSLLPLINLPTIFFYPNQCSYLIDFIGKRQFIFIRQRDEDDIVFISLAKRKRIVFVQPTNWHQKKYSNNKSSLSFCQTKIVYLCLRKLVWWMSIIGEEDGRNFGGWQEQRSVVEDGRKNLRGKCCFSKFNIRGNYKFFQLRWENNRNV